MIGYAIRLVTPTYLLKLSVARTFCEEGSLMNTSILIAILARRRTQPHGHYGKPPKRLLILTSKVAQGLTTYQRVYSSTAQMNLLILLFGMHGSRETIALFGAFKAICKE